MRNPFSNKSKFQIIFFAFMMSYLFIATCAFIAEIYYRSSDNIPTLRTIWLFEFVDRWHWTLIIIFLSYTFISYFVANYLFALKMDNMYKSYTAMNKKIVDEVTEHLPKN